jgi:aspartate racemase
MHSQPLVIVGGMGPQASARLHQLILHKSRAFHDSTGDGYPSIIHISLPIRDFISDQAHEAAAIQQLIALTPQLRHVRPSAILLACNTAHRLVPYVQLLQSPRFVSLISTVTDHVKGRGIRRLGLLASPTTVRTRLYETPLAAQGIACIIPDTTSLERIEAHIRSVIAMRHIPHDTQSLRVLSAPLISQGAEAILLGCTELPIAFASQDVSVPVIDCLDIYADAAVKQYYLYNKK